MDQTKIKKEAALVSYNYSSNLFNKISRDDDSMGYRQCKLNHDWVYSKFRICLRTFHAPVVHLKCTNFFTKYK